MNKARVLSFVLLSFVLLLGACGDNNTSSSSNVDKLNGSWVVATEATIDANKQLKDSIPSGEEGQLAIKMMEEMFSSIIMTFDVKNKTMSGQFMGQTVENSAFEVVSEKDNVIELKMNGDVTPVTIKGDTLEIQADPTTVLVLKRKE